ncbi:hypothetical protein EJ08DRAFT_633360 [Tothia fuscella]|uniref:DUF974 domain-containing protein n=1 Tax=Tothia fuscella TaxID=1048955 RepID=A0A9P4NSX2_9PEZI|nr:hypothetical protein EJ08DRAFT_633360 [Tothia fuscella]
MARARGQSIGEGLKIPHTVSLKVLRLSRPSLYNHNPLSNTDPKHALSISPRASLAYPTAHARDTLTITPLLSLPSSFQSAYVGEEFSCTLCANNELLSEDTTRSISSLRLLAEMQTPSNSAGIPLDFQTSSTPSASASDSARTLGNGKSDDDDGNGDEAAVFESGDSRQSIVNVNLSEEGIHVLAVTVTYTETSLTTEGDGASSGKVRTFRKLYQFVAQSLVGVRTKAGDLPARKDGLGRYALEAQLENLGERSVALEAVAVTPKPPFKSTSLNWDIFGAGTDPAHSPILNPRDVMQVAFLLEEQVDEVDESRGSGDKLILGQLNIQWRSAMGDKGSLSTGWLTGRKK